MYFETSKTNSHYTFYKSKKDLKSYLLFLAMGRSLLIWPCNNRYMSVGYGYMDEAASYADMVKKLTNKPEKEGLNKPATQVRELHYAVTDCLEQDKQRRNIVVLKCSRAGRRIKFR